jgi:hypothetical protein
MAFAAGGESMTPGEAAKHTRGREKKHKLSISHDSILDGKSRHSTFGPG